MSYIFDVIRMRKAPTIRQIGKENDTTRENVYMFNINKCYEFYFTIKMRTIKFDTKRKRALTFAFNKNKMIALATRITI